MTPALRLGLVTEGMIHRTLPDLMAWLSQNAPTVRDLEVGVGGYSPLGHSPLELNPEAQRAWLRLIESSGFRVSAFNVSGNPLHPDPACAGTHDQDLRRAIVLASELGVARIVAMSGCPGAGPSDDAAPHFAANAWLPDYLDIAKWQWNDRVRPYWAEVSEFAERTSPALRICLELHPGAYVFNTNTFEALADVGDNLMVNLDPSHLFWQQMDPFAVLARLGLRVHHSHAKDVRYSAEGLALNGLLDNRWPGDPHEVGWDFAAVGRGVHDETWWARFLETLGSESGATTISIEHEDRLTTPEDGIRRSAEFLSTSIALSESLPPDERVPKH